MQKAINPKGVSTPPYFSQAIEVSGFARTLYVSGQVGVAADGSFPPNVGEQAKLAIANLAEAGMDRDNIVKNTIYLTDPSHMEEFMAAGRELLSSPPAASTLLVVKALANPELLIEIEAVAVAKKHSENDLTVVKLAPANICMRFNESVN